MANIKGISPPTWTEQLLQQATVTTVGYILISILVLLLKTYPFPNYNTNWILVSLFPFSLTRKTSGDLCCYYSRLQQGSTVVYSLFIVVQSHSRYDVSVLSSPLM